MIRSLSLLWILCISFSLNTSAKEYHFERFSSQDGLSQNIVLDVFQDSEGLMWFGTFDGLNMYDGYEFQVFRKGKGNSIVGNRILSIVEDNQNNLWIGSMDEGVSCYNKVSGQYKNYQNTEEQPDLLTSNSVRSLLVDHHQNIWIATLQGLTILSPQDDGSHTITKLVHDSSNPKSLYSNSALCLYEEADGRIWVTTNHSVSFYSGQKDKIDNSFTHVIVSELENGFNHFIKTHFGYLGSDYNGIYILRLNEDEPSNSDVTNLPFHSAEKFALDTDSNLWVGGYDGLRQFEYTHNINNPYQLAQTFHAGEDEKSLSNNYIRTMIMDDAGILWLGTQGKGFMKCNTRKTTFRHYRHTTEEGSIPTNKVWTFHEDLTRNMLLIGTEGGGVSMLSLDEGKAYTKGFTSYPVCPAGQQNFAFDILDISDDDTPSYMVACGYHQMVTKLTQTNNSFNAERIFSQMDRQVMVLCKDEFNTIWLGSYEGGLGRYTPDSEGGSFTRFIPENSPIPTNIIRSITEDSRGRLWIGTDKGLIVLTREQKSKEQLEFTLFTHNENDSTSISNGYTVPVVETSSGEIWIGTFGGGLNKYIEGSSETDGTFVSIQQKDGLPNNTIKSLLEDDEGNLWIGSNGGLTRIDPSRKNIRNFTSYDGIQDLEFTDLSCAKLSDGELLFGGINGFNAFYPHEITEDTLLPQVVLMGLDVNNKPVTPSNEKESILSKNLNYLDEITLQHTQNNFSIHFAAIQYTLPKGNVSKYMLEGVDTEWITSGSEIRFARYAGITPGKYTFKILAANSNGVWNQEARELEIIVKPPYWQTWWFRTLAFVVIAALAGLISLRRYTKRKREKEELQRQIDQGMKMVEQTKEEVEQAKIEIEETKETLRYKEEEEKEIRFFNQGLAEFSELFSQHDTMEALSHATIMKLTPYIDSQLGNFYLVTDASVAEDKQILKLMSTYGGSSNASQTEFMVGESMVGTCFKKGELLEVDNIPQDTVKIASGLGEQTPGYLCYIPIIQGDKKVGVIELAAFRKIDRYKLNFVQKLSEQVGSSILLMRAMMHNRGMIAEVQEKAETLKSQEEMMRLNMEELMASQEDHEREKEKMDKEKNKLKKALHSKEVENKKLQETLSELESENEELRDKLELV